MNRIVKSLVVVIFCFVGHLTIAQETIKTIQERGKIILGTSGQQDPFTFTNEEGTLSGIDIEIAENLASSMGVELFIKEVEFPKLLEELRAGNVDFVMSGMSMKIDRNLEFAFAGPYMKTDKAILTNAKVLKKSEKDKVNQPGIKLVTLRNSTSEKMVLRHYPNATLTLVDGVDMALEKLRTNEADGFVGDFETCVQSALLVENLEVMYIQDIEVYDPLGIAINSNDMLFLNLLQNYLEAVEGSGFMKQLVKKYFGE